MTIKMMTMKVLLIMMLLLPLNKLLNKKLIKKMSKIKMISNKINSKVVKKISKENKKTIKIKKAMRISQQNAKLFLMKTKKRRIFLRYKLSNQRLVKRTKDTNSNIWYISLSSWKIRKTDHPLQTKALLLKPQRLPTLSKKIQKRLHLKYKKRK